MTTKDIYRKTYIGRINKVVDYIDQNIDEPLNLETLAEVANFSPYHFHRLFSAFVGETLNQFVKRLRCEKAASMLLNNRSRAMAEISDLCGFSSQAAFARAFKEYHKMSATEFRMADNNSKNRKTESNNGKSDLTSASYLRNINYNQKRRKEMETKIEVKEMPALDLIYVRHIGQFNLIGQAFEKLMKWAGPRGLLKFPQTKTVTVYHDDPNVTDIEKVRQSACITVDEEVKTEGEIGKISVPAGKYAVGRFEISELEFEAAWNSMCHWLSESGYQPEDGSPYELYHNDHMQHPERKFILDICLPVKPM